LARLLIFRPAGAGKKGIVMNEGTPLVTIIIPITRPAASLSRLLDSLAAQRYSLQRLEVLFVIIAAGVEAESGPEEEMPFFSCRFLYDSGGSLAAARNSGAAAAQGDILLFLGEELEPAPDLVRGHVEAHQARAGCLVIGPYRYPGYERLDFINIKLRSWWEDHFYPLAQTSHRWSYRDVAGGNFSVEASVLRRAGGFNPGLAYGEEYELGLRLLEANVSFVFAPGAVCYYRERRTPAWSFRLAKGEGRLMAFLGQGRPELEAAPFMAHFGAPSLPWRRYTPYIFYRLGFMAPAAGDGLAGLFSRLLSLLERARLRHLWRKVFYGLMMYWYWRGVAQELGPEGGLRRFEQRAPGPLVDQPPAGFSLDIREGLAAAEAMLDQARPASAAVYYGQQYVGDIPPQAGAERLRGVHLRPILAGPLAVPLLRALAVEQVLKTEPEPILFPEISYAGNLETD
jgi:GT2 family glycosyltransferase